jgi:hypothetical protein
MGYRLNGVQNQLLLTVLYASAFSTVSHFHPSLMFAGKAGGCSTIVESNPAPRVRMVTMVTMNKFRNLQNAVLRGFPGTMCQIHTTFFF